MKWLLSGIIALFSFFFSFEWAKNNVIKFSPGIKQANSLLRDRENINVSDYSFTPLSESNSWLQTEPIIVGKDYVLSSLFINMKTNSSDSYVRMQVRDANNDRVLKETDFRKTGSCSLMNLFEKKVYLSLEMRGAGQEVYSFGLKRIPEKIITEGDISVFPGVYFYGEGKLFIDFILRYPAEMDIIIFNEKGTIVDYVLKKQSLNEGRYAFQWDSFYSSSDELYSGAYFVYFRALSEAGKKVEISKKFLFVKK